MGASPLLVDARKIRKGTIIKTDVCIVGAGAAGISLAREFIGQRFRVCLLESGGLESDTDTQSLYEGEIAGLPYTPLHAARLRYFGGTTNHWDGWCRPLDEIDFETRDWIPHSGWPFPKAHLDPFYARAQSICQLGPFPYDVDGWETDKARRIPFVGDRVTTKIIQFSPPTRFGQVYRNEVARAPNISINLYANAVGIETNATASAMTRLRVACLDGNEFWVAPRYCILAAGGIENARLLLLSNSVQKEGLGNRYDLVGRFFADHANLRSGLLLFSDPSTSTSFYRQPVMRNPQPSATPVGTTRESQAVMGIVTVSPEIQRHEKMANCMVLLEDAWWTDMLQGDTLRDSLGSVIGNLDQIAAAAYNKLTGSLVRPKASALVSIIEPVPNPDSHVALGDDRDRLGQRRVRLDWRLTASDKHTIRKTLEVIGAEAGKAGMGRVKVTVDEKETRWPPSLKHEWHHMGTTRMHVQPKKGVVDENCKVHGVSNFFIAGSSVFPTYGFANPTLTIVALAVRLADHLKRLLA